MSNPSQLFLLADHLKLSLLERQRAAALNIDPQPGDAEVARSLSTLKKGIEALEADPLGSNTDDAVQLRRQYNELSLQLSTPSLTTTSPNLQTPNNPSLTPDFASARTTKPASSLRRPDSSSATTGPNPKNVRFRDASPTTTAARAALLPYQDDPDTDTPPDHSALDNQQIHAYHSRVMAEQDRALDVLGASVGRQRELSIQIGDELDEQVQMLGDTEERVDRYQTRLDGARDRLGRVARRAKDNMQLTVIFILIIVLVLLIVILK